MRRRGFTLLEVMVALGLLAAALMAIADLTGNALRNHAYARDLTAATLLARGKLAELEQRYEDIGFKEFDEEDEGDFTDAGRPDLRWRMELVRPPGDLSAEQLIASVAGTADLDQLLAQATAAGLVPAAAAGASGGAASSGGPTTGASPLAGAMGTLIKSQLTAFGEIVKRSLREMRVTVSWREGNTPRGFTVTTHLLVLNPKAPNNARGDDPEVPPNLASLSAAANALTALQGAAGGQGAGAAQGASQGGAQQQVKK